MNAKPQKVNLANRINENYYPYMYCESKSEIEHNTPVQHILVTIGRVAS